MSAYIVGGLALGGIYAISVLGLVLTYKSSRVFNFAHGAIAYFVALAYHRVHTEWGWGILPSAVLCLGLLSPLIGLVLWWALFRHLTHTPPAVRLVSTIGLWVALPPVARMIFGDDPIFEAYGLAPVPVRVFRVAGVSFDADQLAVVVAAAGIALALSLLVRFTGFGLDMRATVDSPRMAEIAGTNTAAITAVSWMLGTFLAGLAGVLLAPILGLELFTFTLLLIASFAAVVIGRMTSLPIAFAGAIGLGLLQSLSGRWLPDTGIFASGFRPSIPFIVMFGFLLGYSNLRQESFTVDPNAGPSTTVEHEAPPRPTDWRRFLRPAALALAVLAVPFVVDEFWLRVAAFGLAYAVIFLSYNVVLGEGGMLSLCQISFAGIGAVTTAQLATNWGWSVLVAVVVGGLVAVPFGLLVALPALRLGDLFLALATLAFAVLMDNLVFPIERFDRFGSGVDVPRPTLGPIGFGDDTAFYFLLAVVFALLAMGVANLRRSTTGLVLAGVRSSEPASSTLGISLVRAKLVAFGVSAFIAGVGGGLLAMAFERATVNTFNAVIGLVWLAVAVTWGVRTVAGALLAGLTFAVLPEVFAQYLPQGWLEVPTMLFGIGAIVLARHPGGVVFHVLDRHRERRVRREARRAQAAETPSGVPA